jgi:hypothetical protein
MNGRVAAIEAGFSPEREPDDPDGPTLKRPTPVGPISPAADLGEISITREARPSFAIAAAPPVPIALPPRAPPRFLTASLLVALAFAALLGLVLAGVALWAPARSPATASPRPESSQASSGLPAQAPAEPIDVDNETVSAAGTAAPAPRDSAPTSPSAKTNARGAPPSRPRKQACTDPLNPKCN